MLNTRVSKPPGFDHYKQSQHGVILQKFVAFSLPRSSVLAVTTTQYSPYHTQILLLTSIEDMDEEHLNSKSAVNDYAHQVFLKMFLPYFHKLGM